MPNHTKPGDKRADFENELARLKQAWDSDDITEQEYYDQSGYLRFDDETGGQTWWLDPEDAIWYVALIGSDDFEPYQPQPATLEPEPPVPEPEDFAPTEPEPPAPEPEPTSPPPEPPATEPEEFAPTEPESSTPEPEPTPLPESQNQSKTLFIGTAAIIIIAVVCGGGFWVYSSFNSSNTPTPTTIVEQPLSAPTRTPSSTNTVTATPLPTKTPTATSQSSDTPAATLPPSPTVINSPMPIATDTPSPTSTTTATALPATDTPTPEPVFSGKFAYPEFDEESTTFNIKLVELPTEQEITTVPNASQPALSPDGTQLAYISWANDNIGLYSISLTEGTQNIVSKMLEAYHPQWSFDNTTKVFEFIKGEQKEVHFSDVPGSGVPDIEKGQTPAWTPDGRLVLQACQRTECGLAVVNTNGTGFKFLTHNTADVAPAVSPDGRWMAYTTNQDENWDVWLINLTGGTPTRLTTSPGRDGIPTWSPNGRWIAFVSEDNTVSNYGRKCTT